MDKPPFDSVRACFFLIAAILGIQCIIALALLSACLYWSASVIEGKWSCENIGVVTSQLLGNALAAAIALGGAFSRKDQ